MAKSRKRKPSFERPDDESSAGTGWVYRSDSAEAKSDPPPAAEAASATDAPRSAPRTTPRAESAAPAAAALPAIAATKPAPAADRVTTARLTVDRYSKYAAAAGLVPVPLVDLAAIGGVQIAMLDALASQYEVPFSRERAKSLIAALLGGLMPSLAGHQMLKAVGPLVGILSVSGFALASTRAVGNLFVTHFEAGGGMHDIDVEQGRSRVLANLNRSQSPSARTSART
jgi:uncharacterized protein (DUF697 family)